MGSNFFDRIRSTLLAQPDETFVRWPAAAGDGATVSLTGKALLDRIEALRGTFRDRGLRAGTPVLLLLPLRPDLLCALLAVMAEGAVPVLPPAGTRRGTLLRLLRQTGARVVLTETPPGALRRGLARLLGVRLWALPVPGAFSGPSTPGVAVAAGQAALLSHSSGSTGTPKAIVRSHAVLSAQHRAIAEVFPPWAGQRDFPLFPNVLLHNLSAGVRSILPAVPSPDWTRFDPRRILDQLEGEGVDTLTGNVFYFETLLRYLRQWPRYLTGVRALGIGGSPVPERLLHALREYLPAARRYVIYGSSEAEPIAVRLVGTPADPLGGYPVGAFHPHLDWRLQPLGRLEIGPGAGQELGELAVRGPHVAGTDPDGWLRTGDFGYVCNGAFTLTGRRGNERLHQGVPHYPIEHGIQHLPGVERVAARAGATGFAVFVQGTVSRETVEAYLRQHVPAALRWTVAFRTSLPVDRRHHSKIQYAALR